MHRRLQARAYPGIARAIVILRNYESAKITWSPRCKNMAVEPEVRRSKRGSGQLSLFAFMSKRSRISGETPGELKPLKYCGPVACLYICACVIIYGADKPGLGLMNVSITIPVDRSDTAETGLLGEGSMHGGI